MATYELESGLSATLHLPAPHLGLPASTTVRNKRLLFKPPSRGLLVTAAPAETVLLHIPLREDLPALSENPPQPLLPSLHPFSCFVSPQDFVLNYMCKYLILHVYKIYSRAY